MLKKNAPMDEKIWMHMKNKYKSIWIIELSQVMIKKKNS